MPNKKPDNKKKPTGKPDKAKAREQYIAKLKEQQQQVRDYICDLVDAKEPVEPEVLERCRLLREELDRLLPHYEPLVTADQVSDLTR